MLKSKSQGDSVWRGTSGTEWGLMQGGCPYKWGKDRSSLCTCEANVEEAMPPVNQEDVLLPEPDPLAPDPSSDSRPAGNGCVLSKPPQLCRSYSSLSQLGCQSPPSSSDAPCHVLKTRFSPKFMYCKYSLLICGFLFLVFIVLDKG